MTDDAKGVLQQKTFSIEWKIGSFFANCKKVGDLYKSSVFSIRYANENTNWYLEVYPKGLREEFKEFVSLYLYFQSENVSEVTVDYQFSIVSEQHILSKLFLEKARTFKGPSTNWGRHKLLGQDAIKNTKNGALVDDTLVILCEITFHQKAQDITEKIADYDNLLNKIGNGFDDYETLLETNSFSDVTFNIQDKKMYLHKVILMCRNPVFKAMFEHDMKEKKQSIVNITDIDYEVMKELFRLIYSGKVENIEEIASDLLIAADKYSVTELKALCEKTLYHNLTIDNAIEYLVLTDMCDTIHLKTLVIKFVAAHHKDVVKKPGFAGLNSNVMYQIMQAIAE